MCFKRFPRQGSNRVLPVAILFNTFQTRRPTATMLIITATKTTAVRRLSFPSWLQISQPRCVASAKSTITPRTQNPFQNISALLLDPDPNSISFSPSRSFLSNKITSRINGYTASLIYGPCMADIRTLPSVEVTPSRPSIHNKPHRLARRREERLQTRIFQERAVLQLARNVRGGDVGIAAYRSTYSSLSSARASSWIHSNPSDDTANQRQVYLRSLMYNRGIVPSTQSSACMTFMKSGQRDPRVIDEELDVENWCSCCTNHCHPYMMFERQHVKLRLPVEQRR